MAVQGPALTYQVRDAFFISAGIARFRKDPLRYFRYASDAQRAMVRLCGTHEVYVRSGNSAGKTWGGAALGVALARGLPELDGEPLPQLGVPNVGWVLTNSYKQQVDSSQKAYLHWVGDFPHHVAYVVGKSKGYIETIYLATDRCQHGTGKNCENCSRIVFHCEESKSSVGGRIDWSHADEPPNYDTWREIRMRRQAGKNLVLFITATPLSRARWYPLQTEFTAETLAYESEVLTGSDATWRVPEGRLAEVRCTMYDNKFLSDDDIAAFVATTEHDPLREARRRGDYVDTSGVCPFPYDLLQERWLPRCRPGRKDKVVVQAEIETSDGRSIVPISLEVESWYDPEPWERYYLILDPSSGVRSRMHDPAGLAVISRVNPRVCLRFNGYVGPYGLGSLAALIGERYNHGAVDVDMTGGFGGPCLTALHAARYRNILSDVDPDKPGLGNTRLGFRISRSNRGEIIGSIQNAILTDSIVIPSREMVDCLMRIVMDENRKIVTAPGQHDEDMILLGRACFLLSTHPRAKPRRAAQSLKDRLTQVFGSRSSLPPVPRERWAR